MKRRTSQTLSAIGRQAILDAKADEDDMQRMDYDIALLSSQTADELFDQLADRDFIYEVCKRLAAMSPRALGYAAETGDEDGVIGDAMREAAKAIDGNRL